MKTRFLPVWFLAIALIGAGWWQGNHAKVYAAPPAISLPVASTIYPATVDVPFSLQVSASDPDGDELTYGAGGLPPGLSIDPETGKISGTPLAAAVNSPSGKTYNAFVAVSDENGESDSVSFQIEVTEQPKPPVIISEDSPSATSVTVEAPVTAGGATGVSFFVSDPNLFSELDVTATGILPYGTPNPLNLSYTITSGQQQKVTLWFAPEDSDYINANVSHIELTVTDNTGLADKIQLKVEPVLPANKQPKIDPAQVVSPIHILEGQPFLHDFTATDEDASLPRLRPEFPGFTPEELTLEMVFLDYEDPSGQVVPPGHGLTSGQLVGTFTRIDFQQNATLGTLVESKFKWDQFPDAQSLIPGTYKLRAQVLDRYGVLTGVSWGFTFTLIVDPLLTNNAPPVWTNPGDQVIAINNPYNKDLSTFVTDADGDNIAFAADGLPNGLFMDGHGVISGTPLVSGTFPVTVHASDGFHPISSDVKFDIVVVPIDTPTLNFDPAVNDPEQVILGNTFSRNIIAADDVPNDVLDITVEIVQVSGTGGTTTNFTLQTVNQQSDANGASLTKQFKWEPDAAGSYVVTAKVQNLQGKITQRTFTINVSSSIELTVTPSSGQAPVGSVYSMTASATAGTGVALEFSMSGQPAGMVYIPPTTSAGPNASATIEWTPTVAQTGQTYSFDVIVTDEFGFSDTVPVTVTVPGNNPPVIQSLSEQFVPVGQSFSATLLVNDPDGDSLIVTTGTLPWWLTYSYNSATNEITFTSTTPPGEGDVGTRTITVSADDGINPPTTTQFDITVVPLGVPTLSSVVGPITLHVGEEFTNVFTSTDSDAGDTLTFAIAADSSGHVTSGFTPQTSDAGPPTTASWKVTWSADTAGTYQVDASVEDAQGHTTIRTFFIEVVNAPPVIEPIADQSVSIGSLVNIPVVATDADNDTLTYNVTGLPTSGNLVFNPSTNAIEGTPQLADVGSYTVTVTVGDGVNTPDQTETFILQIVDQGVPTLSPVNGPITLHVDEEFTNVFTSTDSDADDTLSLTATSTPNTGVSSNITPQSYDGTTQASWKLTWSASTVGHYQVDASVEDGQGHTTIRTFFIEVVNAPPVIEPIADQSVSIGDSVDIQVAAADVDGDTLAYSLTSGPAWLSIDGSTGEITSSPVTAGQVGEYPVTVSVDDGNGHIVTTSFKLIVNAVGVPTLSSVVGPITLHVGEEFTNVFTSTDSDAGDTLTFNAQTSKFDSVAVSWDPYSAAPLINQTYQNGPPTEASGQLVWQATEIGNYRVDVTVTDSQGHQTVQTFYINVVNGPPVIEPIAAQLASIGAPVSIQVDAVDPDGDALNYELVNSPSWLQISNTGEITNSAPLTLSQVGTYTVTVSVDDGVNPAETTSFSLTVSDEGFPVLSSSKDLSQAITLRVGEVFTDTFTSTDSDAGDTATFAVTSNPTANVSANMVTQSFDGGPPTVSSSLLTWSASSEGNYRVDVSVTDSQSHTSTKTFFVNVIPDVPAPAISNPGTWFASVGGFSTMTVAPANSVQDTSSWQWTASNLPLWVTLDKDTGILSGTPGLGDIGTTSVTVSVNDGANPPVSVTFDIVVSNLGIPTLSATPTALGTPEEAITGEGYSRMFRSQDTDYPENLIFGVKVTDVGGNVLMDELSTDANSHIRRIYQSGSLDQGGTIAGAVFDWTASASGIYQVDISVTDQQSHEISLTYSLRFSSPPSISINPATINATPELPLLIPVEISDPDDHETLTVDYGFNAPFNMSFDGSSTFSNVPGSTPKFANLSYTPSLFDANTSYTFDVTVTDSAGLTATQQVTINVGPVNERPVITSPTAGSTKNIVVGHSVSLPVEATDAEGDTLTYSATGLNAVGLGLTIDPSTGVISGSASTAGTYTVTVNVDDGNHVSPAASVTFKIVVGLTNNAPTLDAIADQTIAIGQTLNVQAVGSDPDSDLLNYSQTGLPAWATFDTATGAIGGTPGNGDEGSSLVTVTVDDGYGGVASQSFTLTVTGPFSATVTTGMGYEKITYTVTNTTGDTINPVVRGSLTGGGYLDNENAFFNASQGFVDDQWANPVIQRKLDPTKNTRILTWTVGDLAPGASATLTISVPIKGGTPHGTQLTNTWSVDYGVTHDTVSPVTHP